MSEYIKRGDALTKLFHDGEWVCNVRGVYDAIEAIPKADVKPIRHGQWKWNKNDYGYCCSACGNFWDHDGSYAVFDHDAAVYCPNCGARMDGDSH